MLPLRDTKLSDSLLAGPLWFAGGLSASTRLAVGGLLWLLCSMAFSCWLYGQMEAPASKPHGVSRAAMPFAAAHKSSGEHGGGPGFDRALALEVMDALLARTLPLALPQAQWQRVLSPENPPAEISPSAAGALIPDSPVFPAGQAAYPASSANAADDAAVHRQRPMRSSAPWTGSASGSARPKICIGKGRSLRRCALDTARNP